MQKGESKLEPNGQSGKRQTLVISTIVGGRIVPKEVSRHKQRTRGRAK